MFELRCWSSIPLPIAPMASGNWRYNRWSASQFGLWTFNVWVYLQVKKLIYIQVAYRKISHGSCFMYHRYKSQYSGPCIVRPPLLHAWSCLSWGCGLISGCIWYWKYYLERKEVGLIRQVGLTTWGLTTQGPLYRPRGQCKQIRWTQCDDIPRMTSPIF